MMTGGDAVSRAFAVYCHGGLLDAVQRTGLFQDSKHFVDMPLRVDPEEALAAFEALPVQARSNPERLRSFVEDHFEEPGVELLPHVPRDWHDEPPLLKHVRDPELQELLRALNSLWLTLCRVVAPRVQDAPQRHSILHRRFPVVLPGGRFRETYYWDSYWIVEGMLACGMIETAKGLVQNLLDDVECFGFVPNGSRIYYLNRSQPPLLCEMVATVARALDNGATPNAASDWLATAVPLLLQEYDYWMDRGRGGVDGQRGRHRIDFDVLGGDRHTLNRYYADWDRPRPESYREDVATAVGADTADAAAEIYREIASAAESGWDFSSRWGRAGSISGAFSVGDTATTQVLPVDLNAILYRAERTLAVLAEACDTSSSLRELERRFALEGACTLSSSSAVGLASAAERRRRAIDSSMWREAAGRWVDIPLPRPGRSGGSATGSGLSDGEGQRVVALTDFAAPLWAGLASPAQAEAAVRALRRSGLLGEAGAMTTTTQPASGQQWDAPNAWPPLQSMLIQGLSRLPASSGGPALAEDLAQRWISTCFTAWRRSGFMYEKYDATRLGAGGGGGEYEPQVGFGWSNGVVLQLLRDYGDTLKAPT